MTPRSGPAGSADLSDRSHRVLATLVRQYIDGGEPVSSLWLAAHGGFGCSSATVRNVMSQLEELGYVHQPHTSAGRVPTDLGYRVYVDQLLDSRRAAGSTREVEARLRQAGTVDDVLSNVSHELSRVSHQLSFALMPPTGDTLRRIEFVPLEGAKVLVIVETDDHEVVNKVVEVGERADADELRQGASYINQEFAGLPLWTVRATMTAQLRQERMLYNELLSRALRLASSTLAGLVPANSLFLEGAGFLLEDLADDARESFERLRDLLGMIERKDQLIELLNEYIEGDGLTVVIGAEHASPEMRDFSLVMSTYVDDGRTGSIGIIGPKRMRYSHAIRAVDGMSRAVSRVLVSQGASRQTDHDRRDSRHESRRA